MLIAGIVLIVVSAVLIFMHVSARKRIGALLVAKPKAIGELKALSEQLASELGDGGALSEMVEMVGDVDCAQPLISPLGERPCVHYEMRITRRYEEEYEERDSEGRVRRRTRTGSEVMSSNRESRDFDLVDPDGGRIRVRLDAADFDKLTQSVDDFRPGEQRGAALSFGRFAMQLGGIGHGRRTLGYHYHEEIFGLDGRVTLIGQATDKDGLSVGAGGLAFIVSHRSKQEMLGSAKSSAKMTSIGSGIAALVGVGLTIAGLIAR